MGGGFEGEWIHVYVWLSSFPKTITTLFIDYTPIQNKKLKKIEINFSFLYPLHFSS